MALADLKNLDRTLFGTEIFNYKTKELGLVLYTWTNVFADGKVPYATCVDKNGKKYNIAMDNIIPVEDLDYSKLQELGLKA